MQTIALISQKGGVGKTTLAIHLATAFVAAGYNTLLVDFGPAGLGGGMEGFQGGGNTTGHSDSTRAAYQNH